ncbi:MAG: hypothetical protein NTW04_02515, partial [Elusimicrobia bacterium]|nr:hypothetical protein [Elusimicrobiota bacterium]
AGALGSGEDILDPRRDNMIFDFGNVKDFKPTALNKFYAEIKEKYPAKHRMFLVECPCIQCEGRVAQFSPVSIGRAIACANLASTFYIPAVKN